MWWRSLTGLVLSVALYERSGWPDGGGFSSWDDGQGTTAPLLNVYISQTQPFSFSKYVTNLNKSNKDLTSMWHLIDLTVRTLLFCRISWNISETSLVGTRRDKNTQIRTGQCWWSNQELQVWSGESKVVGTTSACIRLLRSLAAGDYSNDMETTVPSVVLLWQHPKFWNGSQDE